MESFKEKSDTISLMFEKGHTNCPAGNCRKAKVKTERHLGGSVSNPKGKVEVAVDFQEEILG